jgi:Holliday junction resolvasome RuvABC endonuclease subunit
MPEDLKVPHVVRVMGIDPSTTNMGVFVVDVNIAVSAPFELVYANTIYGDKVVYDVPVQFDDTAGTSVSARSFCLARALGTLIEIYKPTVGICEDNFLGMSALTFKQLIQFVGLVREEFNKHDIHLSYVLPNLAKAIVGANFKGTQKEDVRKGLLEYPWLNANGIDLSLLDEHSVDSGAVTLYRCEQIAENYGVARKEPAV